MRTLPRLLAAAMICASLATSVLLVPPALAQSTTATVSWPRDGTKVSDWVPVVARASVGNAGLRQAQLFIDGAVVDSSGAFACPNEKTGADLSYDWNTRTNLSGGGTSANAPHTIKVTSVACGAQPIEGSITVYVNNTPKAPTGVSAAAKGQTVNVSWNANPEPDITGYNVVRDGMSTRVSGTNFSEDLPSGSYRYSIAAVRSGTDGELTSSSVNSNQVTVGQSPPTSDDGGSSDPGSDPTTGPGGGSGSGSSSGGGEGSGSGSEPDPGWGAVEDVDYIDYDKLEVDGGSSGTSSALDTFEVGDVRLAALDLPGMVTLRALPPLPPLDPASDSKDPSRGWGKFIETAPYVPPVQTLAEEAPPNHPFPGSFNLAARSPDYILPPDQLRWMVAGLCALVLAGFFLYLDLRLHAGAPRAVLLRRLSKRRSSEFPG